MAYTTIDDPSAYFQTKLYTAADTYTFDGNSDMQPDWMWIKERNGTNEHNLFDSVRGTTKRLESSTTALEQASSTTLTAFGSDGFTVGNNPGTGQNGSNYVGWGWKAGTSVSGNTTGSGTAKAYTGSVSTASGFSIVKYVGNGSAGHTIPHHLSDTPDLVISKKTSGSGTWFTWGNPLGSNQILELNATSAKYNPNGNYHNDTMPSSSVVTLGSDGEVNENDATYILYCFASKKGYSKIGSYTGNGNADGTFVYTGFKPAWVMVKPTSRTGRWRIKDNKRDINNVMDKRLSAESSDAEGTGSTEYIDFLSNGFKARASEGQWNGSGEKNIYIAFAENPFVTSTGVPTTAR